MKKWSVGIDEENIHYLTEDKKRYIIKTFYNQGEHIGYIEVHPRMQEPDLECAASVGLHGQNWLVPTWHQTGVWPNVSLVPSIKCTQCGNHGYIVDGKWVSV